MRAHNFQDLSGKKYGRLIVLKLSHVKSKKTFFVCRCACGKQAIVYSQKLKSGHTQSCGCLFMETVTKHGGWGSRLYRIYKSIQGRCGKQEHYYHVVLDKQWDTFAKFKKDMEPSYQKHIKKHGEKNTTINRIDIKKGYSKDNCEWATYKKQNNNLSNNIMLTHNGVTKTVSYWYEKFKPKLSRSQFVTRVKRGCSLEDALIKSNRYKND